TRLSEGEKESPTGTKRHLKKVTDETTVAARAEKPYEASPSFAFEDAEAAEGGKRSKDPGAAKRGDLPAEKPKSKTKAKPPANDQELVSAVQSVSRDRRERQKA